MILSTQAGLIALIDGSPTNTQTDLALHRSGWPSNGINSTATRQQAIQATSTLLSQYPTANQVDVPAWQAPLYEASAAFLFGQIYLNDSAANAGNVGVPSTASIAGVSPPAVPAGLLAAPSNVNPQATATGTAGSPLFLNVSSTGGSFLSETFLGIPIWILILIGVFLILRAK